MKLVNLFRKLVLVKAISKHMCGDNILWVILFIEDKQQTPQPYQFYLKAKKIKAYLAYNIFLEINIKSKD